MSFELYNSTNRIKELPKYRYNGRFRLGPHRVKKIDDYMVDFYKPYERIGVIVRSCVDKVDVEPEVKNILNESTTLGNTNDNTDSLDTQSEGTVITESNTLNEEVVSEDISNNDNSETEETTPDKSVTVYTELDLESIKLDEMTKILKDRGVDTSKLKNRRVDYINAILESQ